ncbi:MAG: hypothetical protein AB7O24_04465 [Kofleriaceae bacterium]
MFASAIGVAAGCAGSDGDPKDPIETPVIGFCGNGEAASASGSELLARQPNSYRDECLDGIYENTGYVQGGDFYTNDFVDRLELRDGRALAAIRCTFEGPLSLPPEERAPRAVIATVNVPLAVHEWGIEFLESAHDEKQDPLYYAKCATEILSARWPFCIETEAETIKPPEGENGCVHIESNGKLTSILFTPNNNGNGGGAYSYNPISQKIGD